MMPDRLAATGLEPRTAWLPWQATASDPWNARAARHLLRRACFGADARTVEKAVEAGMEPTVEQLLRPAGLETFNREMDQAAVVLGAGNDARRIAAWWLYRMRHSPDALGENLTLLWHDHFATSANKVQDAELLLRQNQTLRAHAKGSFRAMLGSVTRDPAMLIYLDSTENRKRQPNENFAREVMELFVLGLDEYSQHDVHQLARCFTGMEVRRRQYRFNPYEHDSGTKELFGQSGTYDMDTGLARLLARPAAGRWVAGKLVRWLVTDATLDAAWLEPLAQGLRDSDFDIGKTVETILRSRLMHSAFARGQQVRSPIAWVMGWMRSLAATTDLQDLVEPLREMGQAPLYPPNVSGWPSGETWINSQTLAARVQWLSRMLTASETRFFGGDFNTLNQRLGSQLAERLDRAIEWLLPDPLPDPARDRLLKMVAEASPDMQTRQFLTALAMLPQGHLG